MTSPLRWADVYREADLYKAAIQVYTKPLFAWKKALSTSTDEATLYDFARRGLPRLDRIHRALSAESYHFRPAVALDKNFNGRRRTLYIYPWEERIVDLLLYRVLNERLRDHFSPNSYAYRRGPYGVDACQRKIARTLSSWPRPIYVVKRDIADYFGSVNHDLLLGQLAHLAQPDDYLFSLLRERVAFPYRRDGTVLRAEKGIPFGAAIACLFANIYLTGMDRAVEGIGRLAYFRYADDLLVLTPDRESALKASGVIEGSLESLTLRTNARHRLDLVFPSDDGAGKFRHLGLEFRADGSVGLSRDKFRKICNLFRYAFRRRRGAFRRLKDRRKRVDLAIALVRRTLGQGVRNVAIIDYYLKHVTDEDQLRLLDRWLAEEVLHLGAGKGHRKGNFRLFSYGALREMGLPSLLHRRRLLLHGHIQSPFFIWKTYRVSRGSGGTAARPLRAAFSPRPEAAVGKTLVGESDRL